MVYLKTDPSLYVEPCPWMALYALSREVDHCPWTSILPTGVGLPNAELSFPPSGSLPFIGMISCQLGKETQECDTQIEFNSSHYFPTW